MAEGILYNFAAGILQRLASEVVNEIGLIWGVKEKLLGLEDTMSIIKDVLLDAQEQRIHRRHIKNWLSRLEDVVQDFEDLLDYMETDALRRQGRSNKNQLLKEVCNFFSSSNRVAFRFKMAHWLEDIKKKLAVVQADRREFQLEVRLEEVPLVASDLRFDQTHSFVPEEEVIGRDLDKSNIMNKLLNVDQTNQHVSTIAIVGCGGMGKTSLAQLVFNDKNDIQNHFQLKLWVCVSDVFVVKTIVEQIIKSATNESPDRNSEMDQLQNQLRNELKDKRYLLILDDVWNEDFSKWDELRVLLGVGAMGSRILVTTRSTVVANITGDQEPYHLGILDDGFSWSLFKKRAFKEGYEGNKSIEDIGNEILKKCGGIPIVIKTIGSMLRFKDAENEWQQFLQKELSKVPQYADNIVPRLELSYKHLPSHLKHCFAFCSLFPKDYRFYVEEMIRYWMALGFVNSPDQSRSLEDVGLEYFKELLSRSFFQQVERNKWGDIMRCKMHDCIHDLAIKVAGTECISLNSKGGNIGKSNRHLSFHRDFEQPFPTYLLQAERILTILKPFKLSHLFDESNIYEIISSMKRIRLLDLNSSNIERVPKSIDKLLHLRYLDFSYNSFLATLPNSLCKLQNLQLLKLNFCKYFRKWPKDFGKLVNLRHLEFMGCEFLQEWPKDIDKLVNLRHLNFKCYYNEVLVSGMPRGLSQLTNLQTLSPLKIDVNMEFWILVDLKNLRGAELKVVNLKHKKYEISKANLKEKQFNSIILEWKNNGEVDNDETKATADEETLQDLQPSQNLKELKLDGYCGYKCSSWFDSLTNVFRIELKNCKNLKYLPGLAHLPALKELILENVPALVCISSNNSEELICRSSSSSSKSTLFFPSLEELTLKKCANLQYLPGLAHLPALKKLILKNLPALVCISSEELICRSSSSSSKSSSFFPSLKKLTLKDMPSLKGWWNTNDEDNSLLRILPTFPCLSELTILKCPRLNCMPFIPSLDENLRFDYISWKGILQSTLMMNDIEGASTTTSSASHLTKLREMTLTDFEDIESLLLSSKSLTSLKYLGIQKCPRLKSIFSDIQHLTSLQTLSIGNCEELELLFDDVTLSKSLVDLSSLYLSHLPKVEAFPDCISNLKSLKVLCIHNLENLNSSGLKGICSLPSLEGLSLGSCNRLLTLPQEICRLSSSLKKLRISNCPDFHFLPEEIFSLTSLEILDLTRLPELKSLPQKHLLDNIQEIYFWNNERKKVFIKSVQSQDRDPPTNLKLHIRGMPHLEKPVRNSGFHYHMKGIFVHN